MFACSRMPPALPDEAQVVALMVDINTAPQQNEGESDKNWEACVRALLQTRPKHSGANVLPRDDFKRTCL